VPDKWGTHQGKKVAWPWNEIGWQQRRNKDAKHILKIFKSRLCRLMLRNMQKLRFNWLGRQKCKEFNLSFYIKQKTVVGHLLQNRSSKKLTCFWKISSKTAAKPRDERVVG
jgi:hypothetical protein